MSPTWGSTASRTESSPPTPSETCPTALLGARFGPSMRELETHICPDENQLLLSVQGMLSSRERQAIEEHIDHCVECRRVVAQLIQVSAAPETKVEPPSSTLIRIPAGPNLAESDNAPQLLPRGTNLGRYVILDCLGR